MHDDELDFHPKNQFKMYKNGNSIVNAPNKYSHHIKADEQTNKQTKNTDIFLSFRIAHEYIH